MGVRRRKQRSACQIGYHDVGNPQVERMIVPFLEPLPRQGEAIE